MVALVPVLALTLSGLLCHGVKADIPIEIYNLFLATLPGCPEPILRIIHSYAFHIFSPNCIHPMGTLNQEGYSGYETQK